MMSSALERFRSFYPSGPRDAGLSTHLSACHERRGGYSPVQFGEVITHDQLEGSLVHTFSFVSLKLSGGLHPGASRRITILAHGFGRGSYGDGGVVSIR